MGNDHCCRKHLPDAEGLDLPEENEQLPRLSVDTENKIDTGNTEKPKEWAHNNGIWPGELRFGHRSRMDSIMLYLESTSETLLKRLCRVEFLVGDQIIYESTPDTQSDLLPEFNCLLNDSIAVVGQCPVVCEVWFLHYRVLIHHTVDVQHSHAFTECVPQKKVSS